MRRLALSVFATVCCICAYSAQYYRISSVGNGNPNTKLKYVGQTDSTTQILATFTLPDNATEALLLNVSRKTYVTDGDGCPKQYGEALSCRIGQDTR